METLIASSFFSDEHWKSNAIRLAKQYQGRDMFLRSLTATRESSLLRMQRALAPSEQVVHDFDKSSGLEMVQNPSLDPRTQSQINHLRISEALNVIERDSLETAIQKLGNIFKETSSGRSSLELLVNMRARLVLARTLRYQGKFDEADELARECIAQVQLGPPYDQDRHPILGEVADIHCERGLPAMAINILAGELDATQTQGRPNSTWTRRLKLGLAEAMMQCDQLEAATEILQKLEEEYRKSTEVTRIGQLRLQICLARVFHMQAQWDLALQHWVKANKFASAYHLGCGQTSAIIHRSICHVLLMQGKADDAKVALDAAHKALRPGGSPCWIAGLGSFWSQYLGSKLEREQERLNVSQ